jgi:hypothetical protein
MQRQPINNIFSLSKFNAPAFVGLDSGLPDFSWSESTKTGKVYQMTTNYTKRPYIIPNGNKLYQMAVKYANIFHPKALQNIPKYGFFGLKINNLAILGLVAFPLLFLPYLSVL